MEIPWHVQRTHGISELPNALDIVGNERQKAIKDD